MDKEPKAILSFTSHKARLPLIDDIFRSHVAAAEACGMSVSFSCQDDSIPFMTAYQKRLVNSGKVELLHVPKDHGSNTKWTLCRQAHPDAVMIVVDDDWEFSAESLRSLLETHVRNPEAVVCRAFRTIPWVGKSMPLYEVTPVYTYPKVATPYTGANLHKDRLVKEEIVVPAGSAFPEHVLGLLYPPRFPKCSPDSIPESCRTDDDVFIGSRIAAEERELVFAGRPTVAVDTNRDLPGSLWRNSRMGNGKRTYDALVSVQSDFRKAFGEIGLGEVFLLTCKKYPNRRESMKKELARLGIEYEEQFDDGTNLPNIGFKHRRLNRCHLAKYLALSRFLESPSERVTIIEDDIRFLKNIAEVSEAVQAIPQDFGACRFSWAASPELRREMKAREPVRVVETDMEMAKSGSFWVKCPWASTDGCTVMTKAVAEQFHKELDALIKKADNGVMDNSDDLLCRVCGRLGKPMYVYKPLVCIQVDCGSAEKGKSPVAKFLRSSSYAVPGIVRNADAYAFCENLAESKAPIVRPSPKPRAMTTSPNNRFCGIWSR